MMCHFGSRLATRRLPSSMKRMLTLSISLVSWRNASSLSLSTIAHHRVCVTTQHHDASKLGDGSFLVDVARQVASDLSINYFPLNQSIGDGGETDKYSHVLDVVPFQVGDVSTYALGIRALASMDSESKKKSSRRRRGIGQNKGSPSPFIVDFCPSPDSPIGKRSKGTSGTSDLLIKAVSPGKIAAANSGEAKVYDLTAGFGQDSLLILENGASEVCMVERDPIVATLLQDALRRRDLHLANSKEDEYDDGYLHEDKKEKKLSLQVGHGDTIAKSLTPDEFPHVCYLDPMFPPRTKSAAVKKNMQVLHSLLGSQVADDEETIKQETELLEAALSIAQIRVVVKRPINAPTLGDRKPSYDLRGSVNRWDVYITNS